MNLLKMSSKYFYLIKYKIIVISDDKFSAPPKPLILHQKAIILDKHQAWSESSLSPIPKVYMEKWGKWIAVALF